jgi:hypothetical protein
VADGARETGGASEAPDDPPEEGLTVQDEIRAGVVENVAVLDLTSTRSIEELEHLTRIENVALVLVPESLAGALSRVPMRNVASVVPVPDGATVRLHTGAVVLGGDALAEPGDDDVVLIVTGTLAFSSPVTEVNYRQVIVTGMVLAPYGSERALGSGLSRVTGSVQYYHHVEGQRFRTLSGQTRISGETLANRGGDPADILFLIGQTLVTSPVPEVGYQHVVAAGQLLLPRESEGTLAPVLTMEGMLVWYDGRPRFFTGGETFSRAFLELLDEPLELALVGRFTFADDVPPGLLREKISGITLVGKLVAPEALVPVLQLLVTEKHGPITSEQDDGERG